MSRSEYGLRAQDLDRIVSSNGVLESGQIANMRTYRLPENGRVHVRLVGERRTLCGRSIVHNEQWAWQTINRGLVGRSRPSHVDGRDGCRRCLASPVLRATPSARRP